MSRDDRLSRIGESTDAWRARKDSNKKLAYERKIVRKILIELGVPRMQLKLDMPETPEDQEWYMTLAWMEHMYSSCSMHFTVMETWNPDVWDLLRIRTRRNSFWPKWKELKEQFKEADKPIVCFFSLPQASGLGEAVLHNADLPYLSTEKPQDLIRFHRVTPTGENISMELLSSFIHRLGLVWDPLQ
jgi:hypothetical protein